ncbi:hypothetical protein [Streptomyces sp. NPDC001380]|uniref:hypothetical protein n=1 Tax=Streptomyces sp. NPDC001380 TaxID=3364566 RepID=UPI0036802CCC
MAAAGGAIGGWVLWWVVFFAPLPLVPRFEMPHQVVVNGTQTLVLPNLFAIVSLVVCFFAFPVVGARTAAEATVRR